MLQEFIMIPLDIFRRNMENKSIETHLEAWLTFLTDDNPERVIELITQYPEFKPMYETLYQMCLNVERVMDMFFSEELRILDRNTVQYMIDEQQKELDEQQKELEERQKIIDQQEKINLQQAEEISRLKMELERVRSSNS